VISTTALVKLRFSAQVRSRLKFKNLGNPKIYAQFLKELQEVGFGITGTYSLLEFPKTVEKLNSRDVTARQTLYVIMKIISIRGLPRFLAQISLKEEIKYRDLHAQSRIYILWLLVINHKKLLRMIRSVKISQFNIADIPKRCIRAPFFPWDKTEFWEQESYYIIPDYLNYNQLELKLKTENQKKSLLKAIYNDSPMNFLKILSEVDSSQVTTVNLRQKMPIISDYLSCYKKLVCAFDVNSHLTIDQAFAISKPIRKISNAEIWHAVHIVHDGNWIIKDITEHPKQKFVAGHSHFVSKNAKEVILATPRGKMVKIESGFLLTKRCDENWYHFLLDLLPQVLFLRNLPPKTKIIVRDDLPDSAKAVLKYLQLETIFVSVTSKISVKNLYYIPHRSSVFDSPVRAGKFPRVLFPEQALLKLRDRLKNFEPDNEKLVGHPTIFVLRSGKYRNCKNLPEIERVLVEQGFKEIKIDKMYLKNQFALFRNSDSIVLSGGAIVANMIFMKKLTSMVVLGSWRSASLGLWSRLGLVFGVRVVEIKGIPTSFSLDYSRRLHSDYFIPKVLLRRYLKR